MDTPTAPRKFNPAHYLCHECREPATHLYRRRPDEADYCCNQCVDVDGEDAVELREVTCPPTGTRVQITPLGFEGTILGRLTAWEGEMVAVDTGNVLHMVHPCCVWLASEHDADKPLGTVELDTPGIPCDADEDFVEAGHVVCAHCEQSTPEEHTTMIYAADGPETICLACERDLLEECPPDQGLTMVDLFGEDGPNGYRSGSLDCDRDTRNTFVCSACGDETHDSNAHREGERNNPVYVCGACAAEAREIRRERDYDEEY